MAVEIMERFAWLPPVSAAADTALWERFQQRRATALQPPATKPTPTDHVSAFDWLGHRSQSLQKKEPFMTHLGMMPRKVERGQHQIGVKNTLVDPPVSLKNNAAGQLARKDAASPAPSMRWIQREAGPRRERVKPAKSSSV